MAFQSLPLFALDYAFIYVFRLRNASALVHEPSRYCTLNSFLRLRCRVAKMEKQAQQTQLANQQHASSGGMLTYSYAHHMPVSSAGGPRS